MNTSSRTDPWGGGICLVSHPFNSLSPASLPREEYCAVEEALRKVARLIQIGRWEATIRNDQSTSAEHVELVELDKVIEDSASDALHTTESPHAFATSTSFDTSHLKYQALGRLRGALYPDEPLTAEDRHPEVTLGVNVDVDVGVSSDRLKVSGNSSQSRPIDIGSIHGNGGGSSKDEAEVVRKVVLDRTTDSKPNHKTLGGNPSSGSISFSSSSSSSSTTSSASSMSATTSSPLLLPLLSAGPQQSESLGSIGSTIGDHIWGSDENGGDGFEDFSAVERWATVGLIRQDGDDVDVDVIERFSDDDDDGEDNATEMLDLSSKRRYMTRNKYNDQRQLRPTYRYATGTTHVGTPATAATSLDNHESNNGANTSNISDSKDASSDILNERVGEISMSRTIAPSTADLSSADDQGQKGREDKAVLRNVDPALVTRWINATGVGPRGRKHNKDGRECMIRFSDGCTLYEPVLYPQRLVTRGDRAARDQILMNLDTAVKRAHHRLAPRLEILISDMAAFKAANQGCTFADFVRWYSPNDYNSQGDADIRQQGDKGLNDKTSRLVNSRYECLSRRMRQRRLREEGQRGIAGGYHDNGDDDDNGSDYGGLMGENKADQVGHGHVNVTDDANAVDRVWDRAVDGHHLWHAAWKVVPDMSVCEQLDKRFAAAQEGRWRSECEQELEELVREYYHSLYMYPTV